jgi:hypothetical protein
VTADFDCADEGGSGLASCVGPVADGAAIDTSTTGEHRFTVTATDGEGNDAATTHTYTVLDPPRPDGRIRKGATGPLAGDGVYNETGTGQTRSGTAARGSSVTYFASVQNDAPYADVLDLQGTASTARFRVRYLRGTTDITAAMVAGTYATASLAPGATQVLKVVVTVRATAPRGARLTGQLTASSGAAADTVKFVTSRAPG